MINIKDTAHPFKDDAEKNAYECVAKIDKILVGHELFEKALEGINGCIKASINSREPVNCMLLGDGGLGKTTLATVIQKSMKPETVIENDLRIQTVPAFYTSFKSARTLDAITTDILRKLKDPHPTIGKIGDKAGRVLHLMKLCRTRIIFVDEVHDLDGFEKRNYQKMEKFFKWIKELCNECGPVICLMGITQCHNVFDSDTQMSRRFKNKYYLNPLTVGTKAEPGLLPGFLRDMRAEIIVRTPLKSMPPMDEYLYSLQVFAATGGNLDFIMTLIKEAARSALLEKRISVEIMDFSKVWADGILDSVSKVPFNPFLATEAELAAAFRKQIR